MMEVVRVDNDGDHPVAGSCCWILPKSRAAELHEIVRDRISPLRNDIERMAPIHIDHGVYFHAVKGSENGPSLLEQAFHPAAAPIAQRKRNCPSRADEKAHAAKDDGKKPTPPESILNHAGGRFGVDQNGYVL